MRVTFGNRLKKEERLGSPHHIVFNHALRAPITVRLVYDPQKPEAEGMDWSVKLEAKSKLLIEQLRNDIIRELQRYLEQRTRRCVRSIKFEVIIELAEAKEIMGANTFTPKDDEN
jgi:hypothetical protein